MKSHPLLPVFREFAVDPPSIQLEGRIVYRVPRDDFCILAALASRRAGWHINLTAEGEEREVFARGKLRVRPTPGDEMGPWPDGPFRFLRGSPSKAKRHITKFPALDVQPDDEVPSDARKALVKHFGLTVRRFRDLVPFSPFVLEDEVAVCSECGGTFRADGAEKCDECVSDYDPEPLFRWLDAEDEFENWLESIGGEEVLSSLSDEEISRLAGNGDGHQAVRGGE